MQADPKTVELEAQRSATSAYAQGTVADGRKKPWWHPIIEPGSAVQIVIAALLATAIGLVVTTQASTIPRAVPVILMIPGELWLRALKAVGMSPGRPSGPRAVRSLTGWQSCRSSSAP